MNSQVIELLQQEVARVVVDAGGGMVAGVLQEHLERRAVEEVGAGMQLVAEDAAVVAGQVEQRPPAAGQLREGLVDQPGGRCGQGYTRCQAKPPDSTGMLRSPRLAEARMHFFSSLGRPFGARRAAQSRRMKRREADLVRGMHRQHLALQIAGDLGDSKPECGELAR